MGSSGYNVFAEALHAGWVVMGVLLLLVLMSMISWIIIGYKWALLRTVRKQTERFLSLFWESTSLDTLYEASEELKYSPVSRVFRAAFTEMRRLQSSGSDKDIAFENVERSLRRAIQSEMSRLERHLSFLATTGSAAPFIGLFGTVWGIMNAFGDISPDKPILESVAPHIAHALVATAIGLFAAIPAVIAYNSFSSRLKEIQVEMDNFSIDFLNILKRLMARG